MLSSSAFLFFDLLFLSFPRPAHGSFGVGRGIEFFRVLLFDREVTMPMVSAFLELDMAKKSLGDSATAIFLAESAGTTLSLEVIFL